MWLSVLKGPNEILNTEFNMNFLIFRIQRVVKFVFGLDLLESEDFLKTSLMLFWGF